MILAHDAVGPSELWSSWHPEPVVLAGLVLAAWLYGLGLSRLSSRQRPRTGGVRRTDAHPRPLVDRRSAADRRSLADRRPAAAHRPSSVRPRHAVAFAAALLVLALALASPLETAASSLFTAHMVQHLLLIVVAAPLLVVGRSGLVATAGLPGRPRRLLRRTRARPRLRRAGDVVWHPVAVWGLGAAVLWAWHLPALYEAAVRHDTVHALEHLSLVGVAALLWAAVLGRGRRTLAVPVAALLLFAASLQSTALGAVLAFARAPLYAVHEPVAPEWGLTPLQDQQIAGGLMWVPPGIIYMSVIAALLARWFAGIGEPADAAPGRAAAAPEPAAPAPEAATPAPEPAAPAPEPAAPAPEPAAPAPEPAAPAPEPATPAPEPATPAPEPVAEAVARNEPSAHALPTGGRVVDVVAKERS